MGGNAAEWCRDYFTDDSYKSRKKGALNPENTKPSFSRVLRGGGFRSPPEMCTATARIGLAPNTSMDWIGFRVMLSRK